jgi:hypothetical protein
VTGLIDVGVLAGLRGRFFGLFTTLSSEKVAATIVAFMRVAIKAVAGAASWHCQRTDRRAGAVVARGQAMTAVAGRKGFTERGVLREPKASLGFWPRSKDATLSRGGWVRLVYPESRDAPME